MNQATQQISSNPARDFANAILEESNNGLELIEILHDIAQGNDEKATGNDRIAANTILLDRGLGKCPKQSPVTIGANPDPAPETNTKEPKANEEPESPRLVTQIDQSLHDSLGPAPSAHTEPALSLPKGHSRAQPALVPRHGGGNPESYDISDFPEQENPEPLDPYSIQATIQQHILAITDNCRTLHDALFEIARAKDDPKLKTSHRWRATRILLDRGAGTDPNALRNAVCPECRRTWATHPAPDCHSERSAAESKNLQTPDSADKDVHSKEVWDGIIAELKQKVEAGILTPDPNAPKRDYSRHFPPKDFDMTPYAAEGAAKFRAANALRLERRKQWPAIEERRRKKLEQIYPSHSDDEPPDQ